MVTLWLASVSSSLVEVFGSSSRQYTSSGQFPSCARYFRMYCYHTTCNIKLCWSRWNLNKKANKIIDAFSRLVNLISMAIASWIETVCSQLVIRPSHSDVWVVFVKYNTNVATFGRFHTQIISNIQFNPWKITKTKTTFMQVYPFPFWIIESKFNLFPIPCCKSLQ